MSIEAYSEELTNFIENKIGGLIGEAQTCNCEGAKIIHAEREDIEKRASDFADQISVLQTELTYFLDQLDYISLNFPPWQP